MRNSCAVCSLAVALCLVIFVSATDKVTHEEATAAVRDAKAAVKTVCARAKTQFENATNVLNKVELSNSEAAQASSEAAEAATGNPTAVEIANTIKSLSDAVAASHSDTKQRLTTVVSTLTPFLTEAQTLENEPEITLPPNKDTADDFTATKDKATNLKQRAEELDGQITTALEQIDDLCSKANDMEKKAKDTQIGFFQVSTIVAIAKIKTIMGETEICLQTIQTKKNEVNGIVEEIKTHCKKDPIESNETLKKQCNSADDLLISSTGAVEDAKNAMTKIEQQKGLADTALTNVQKEETDVATAKQEADKAKACGTTADDIFPQLNTALKNAETSLKTANDLKQEIETALSKATSDLSNTQSKETSQSNSPVGQSTEPDQKDTTIQPTSKELPDQSNGSADKLKDALIKGAQNVPTTALTGGKAPAPGAKNDSAMTVSVPLLVALIASAVLQ